MKEVNFYERKDSNLIDQKIQFERKKNEILFKANKLLEIRKNYISKNNNQSNLQNIDTIIKIRNQTSKSVVKNNKTCLSKGVANRYVKKGRFDRQSKISEKIIKFARGSQSLKKGKAVRYTNIEKQRSGYLGSEVLLDVLKKHFGGKKG